MSNPRIPYRMASDRKRLAPPRSGKPPIVHVVVNVENWPFDQPMPRKLLPGPHGNDKIPDEGRAGAALSRQPIARPSPGRAGTRNGCDIAARFRDRGSLR